MKKRNKKEDLTKLAHAFYKNLEITPWEFGGIGLNPKRPFGNSDVPGDMLKIIGCKKEGRDEEGPCYTDRQIQYVIDLYRKDLVPFLRKNWLVKEKSGAVAETAVRTRDYEEYKKGKAAIRSLKDLYHALNSNTFDFAASVVELYRSWRNEFEK